mgnify:FL=1
MSHLFNDCSEREGLMYVSAYDTICRLEAWEFLETYEPPEEKGFMWDNNPTVLKIMNEICNNYGNNHSGCSLASTMRKMQQIAKKRPGLPR